jgi:pyruvate kinase
VKKTKVLATYGPAIASVAMIRRLVKTGVNAFRVNCSHGSHDDFVKAAAVIRQGTRGAVYPIGLLVDISGPKLRLDRFDGEIKIAKGKRITLTAGRSNLGQGIVGVNHPGIIRSLKKGETVYIDDGRYAFTVVSADSRQAVIRSLNAGTLLPGKGINLPQSDIRIPTITAKDREDIKTAVELDADFIALSFVRSGDDILEAKKIIHRLGGRQKLIAKLEKREAIDNLDDIMLMSDGVMVARGDLGVELPPAEVPRLQKRIIALANMHHKPVIVATQMLESMRFSPRPTRAEVNDVASAVFDFADAVMLSAETATGKYPLETVQTMTAVIDSTEAACVTPTVLQREQMLVPPVPFAIAEAVSRANVHCKSEVIFAYTTSGFTAELISNLFPPQPVIALAPDLKMVRRLSLFRSVYPIHIAQPKSFDDMMKFADRVCRKFKLARPGHKVIITGGAPFGSTAPTNFMMFHEVT